MRVLIVSPLYPPRLRVGALRTFSFARGFADAGHDVSVLTTAKRPDQGGLHVHDPRVRVVELPWRCGPLIDRLRASCEVSPEIHVPGRGKGFLGRLKERTGVFSSTRMPDLTDGWVEPAQAWGHANAPFDVVVSSSGPYTAHLVGLGLRQCARCWIADFRDLWTDNPTFPGLYPFTMRERALERRVLAQADVVTTVSRPLAEQLGRLGAGRVEVIYNGHFEQEIEPVPGERVFAGDGLRRIVYTGSIYPRQQDCRQIFAALALLGEQARRFRLVAAGPALPYWQALAEEHGLGHLLEHRGAVPRPMALAMQRDADALLAVEFAGASDGVLSGKIFEYLASQAPIIVTGPRGCVGDLVEQTGRGVAAESPEQVRQILAALLESRPVVHARRRDDLIASFTREAQAARLCQLAESCLDVPAVQAL
ncbi:MAG: glycosyltransferase [Leptolyngbya sp. PLA3]|nr:MAG: glycosyltransferase [Cyanobacteria bacterium CYA]MCE7967822.1 glycosyltransferase [Leptolyngbya sp. PL-A3]